MKLLYMVLVLFVALNSWGVVRHIVSEEDIGKFPVVACMHESNGHTTYVVYFRDTGRFKGLAGVDLYIVDDASGVTLFLGSLEMFDADQGLKYSRFILEENMVKETTLEIYASSQKNTTYHIPVGLLHAHFKDNIASGVQPAADHAPAIDAFLKKEFEDIYTEK